MSEKRVSIVWALLAAALYAISSPVSKVLLGDVSPTMMAALLYLGAGLGMLLLGVIRRQAGLGASEQRLTRKDLPYTVGMIALDIAAPICLMAGLATTTSANASLLNNFEIVATSLIALLVFREAISRRLWIAIGLITLSSLILSFEDASSLSFSSGSLLVLAACVCWGFENNWRLKDCLPLGALALDGGLPPNEADGHIVPKRGVEKLIELILGLRLRLVKKPSFDCLCLALLDAPALEGVNISHLDWVEDVIPLLEHAGRIHVRGVGDDVGGI